MEKESHGCHWQLQTKTVSDQNIDVNIFFSVKIKTHAIPDQDANLGKSTKNIVSAKLHIIKPS